MELHVSPTSPFARNVRIAVIELGLEDRVRQVVVDPWSDESYRAVNPLAKVPALRLEDGGTLTESTVIAACLDELAGGRLFADRWPTLRLAGLANGMTEAVVKLVIEGRRPADRQWQPAIDRQFQAVGAALSVLEAEPFVPGFGEISLAVALAYLEFRCPAYRWRDRHPRLAAHLASSDDRASFQQTRPPQ